MTKMGTTINTHKLRSMLLRVLFVAVACAQFPVPVVHCHAHEIGDNSLVESRLADHLIRHHRYEAVLLDNKDRDEEGWHVHFLMPWELGCGEPSDGDQRCCRSLGCWSDSTRITETERADNTFPIPSEYQRLSWQVVAGAQISINLDRLFSHEFCLSEQNNRIALLCVMRC